MEDRSVIHPRGHAVLTTLDIERDSIHPRPICLPLEKTQHPSYKTHGHGR
jgi:hypothetical protein